MSDNLQIRLNGWSGDEFSQEEDITNALEELTGSPRAGGVVLFAARGKKYIDVGDVHTAIEGPSGSKKSRCIMSPSILSAGLAKENMIVTCTKGTLYNQTVTELNKNGYSVYVINFRNPREGDGWNPLELPYALYLRGESDKAAEMIDDIAYNMTHDRQTMESNAEPFWDNAASDYLSGMIQALFECGEQEEIHMKSISSMLICGETRFGSNTYAREFFHNIGLMSDSYTRASGTIEAPNDTKRSILSVLSQRIRLFSTNNALIDLLSHTTFSMHKLVTEPKTALFLLLPDEKETYHVLASIFIKQLYEYMICIAQNEHHGTLPVRVNYILDEFSNLPAIKDFPAMISAARSRNIRFALAYQSFSQLISRYGKQDAETIIENCTNTVFFHSRNLERLKTLSGLCGQQYRYINGVREERPLISVTQLQQLQKGEALIFHDRMPPYVTVLPDISEYFSYSEPTHIPITARDPSNLKIFNMATYVHNKKKEEMMSKLLKDEPISSSQNDVDELIKRIDDRIAELDEQEKEDKKEE